MDKEECFNLTSIGKLMEFDSYKEANKYLELGWLLISTHLNDYGHPIERHQKTIYCLGWSRLTGEPKYPESKVYSSSFNINENPF